MGRLCGFSAPHSLSVDSFQSLHHPRRDTGFGGDVVGVVVVRRGDHAQRCPTVHALAPLETPEVRVARSTKGREHVSGSDLTRRQTVLVDFKVHYRRGITRQEPLCAEKHVSLCPFYIYFDEIHTVDGEPRESCIKRCDLAVMCRGIGPAKVRR